MHSKGKRRATSDNKEQPTKNKRVRKLTLDAQWCVENSATMTLKGFAERFGYMDRQKCVTRYRNIIRRYLLDECQRLLHDLDTWRNTASWEQFWMQKQREAAKLETHKSCLNYAQKVLRAETSSITGHQHASSSAYVATASNNEDASEDQSTATDFDYDIDDQLIAAKRDHRDDANDGQRNEIGRDIVNIPAQALDQPHKCPEETSSSNTATPTNILWIIENVNVSERFRKYQHSAKSVSTAEPLIIAESLHDILSLTDVLLLCPNQHCKLMIDHFGQNNLGNVTEALLQKTLDTRLDWADDEYIKLTRIINKLKKDIKVVDQEKRAIALDNAEMQLHILSNDMHPVKKAIIKGIIGAIGKLPAVDLKEQSVLGKNELICTYFDPILSRIIANPAYNVHLRWSDTAAPETPGQRLDAVVSNMTQLSFGASLGFGEAKIEDTTLHDLCHDLFRLAIFSKESMDISRLDACITFQIHGYGITFYLTQLPHHGIYTMLEIGHVAFPRSISDISSFINLKTLTTLLQLTDAFWRLCHRSDDPDTIASRGRPTYEVLYDVISSKRSSSYECSIHFEK